LISTGVAVYIPSGYGFVMPKPETKMVALNARIPEQLYRDLGKAKYDRGKSIQQMVEEALRHYLSSPAASKPSPTPRPRRE
jgi:hypothetical protein